MQPLRDQLIDRLASMPADSTFDQMVYELMLTASIRAGIEDADAGRVISNEEMRRRIDRLRVAGVPITEPMEPSEQS